MTSHTLINRLLFIFLLMSLMNPSQSDDADLESLTQLKWKNRIILIHSISNTTDILSILKNASSHIQERHITWFVFSQNDTHTNHQGVIADNFAVDVINRYFTEDEIDMVLIGKDGYVKARAKDFDLNPFFQLIDSMPMRQMEMQDQQHKAQ